MNLKTFFFLTFIILAIIYRQAFFGEKIILPTNYLVGFYSPWSVYKFPEWSHGVPFKPIGADQLRFFYPQRLFTNKELFSGQIPFWNPYIFSGNPHLANFQSAVFYPLNFLYLILPQMVAWSLLIFLQPLLAATFTYLYLSDLKLPKTAVFLGSFSFGFSGYIITWSQEAMALGHSVIWLPLALVGIERKKYWITVLAISFSILAGYLQTTIYICLLIISYAFFRKTNPKSILYFCIVPILLCAIQIIPSTESFFLSVRPTAQIEYVFNTYLLPLNHLIKSAVPDIHGNPGSGNYFGTGSYNETSLYIGLPPLIFAIYAIVRNKKPLVFFFATTASLSFLLTSNFPFIRWLLHLPVPLIPTFQPSRILILTTFSLSVLAALGLSSWLTEKKHPKIIAIICMVIGVLITLELAKIKSSFSIRDFLVATKNSFLAIGILGAILGLALLPLRKLLIPGALVLTVISQLYFFNKYLSLGNKEFLYPCIPIWEYLQKNSSSYSRFVSFGNQILGNFSVPYEIPTAEGYDPIFSKRYGQLVFAARDFMKGKLTEDLPRIEVTMSQLRATDSGKITESMIENFPRLRLLSLLGVKNILYFDSSTAPSILETYEIFPPKLFTPIAVINGWQIYEYKNALPRIFLAGKYIVETDDQKIIDKIFDPNFDLQTTLILEKPLPLDIQPSLGNARITTYQANKVIISAQTQTPQLLFLSDNYYPGWKATINNKPTEIYRTNYSFRSVLLPPGNHEITFYYDPKSFKIGAIITLTTIIIVGGRLLFSQTFGIVDQFLKTLAQLLKTFFRKNHQQDLSCATAEGN